MHTTRTKILTGNIAHGRGPKSESNILCLSPSDTLNRLNDMATLITSYDIVCLQEVDFRYPWSGGVVNQYRFLKKKAAFPYGMTFTSHGIWPRSGLAIFSRFPLSDREVIQLPQHSPFGKLIGYRKHALACTVRIPELGTRFKLVNIHLDYHGHHVTIPGAEELIKYTRLQDLPVVMAGDFNSTPQLFPNSWTTSPTAMDALHTCELFQFHPQSNPQQKDFTFPATDPRVIIDWILSPTTPGWVMEDYRTIRAALSDHDPVSATIVIPQSTTT